MQHAVLPAIDIAKSGIAHAHGFLQHGFEHRLQFAGRAADNLQHLRRGGLLPQRLGEVGGALGEVGSALPQFVEKPRILDGDDGLGGEVLHQLDLLVGEGPYFLAGKSECADEFIILQHRHDD